MKRVVLTVVILLIGFSIFVLNPEVASLNSYLVLVIVALAFLTISLVIFPITKFITVEKLKEVTSSASFRKSIGFFRNKQARFFISNGLPIEGKLVGRSDSFNTFTVETEKGVYRTFPQNSLISIESLEGDISHKFLDWEEPKLEIAI